MGCVASKLEEEEEAVTICRERKRQLKLAVERRYALAEAHCRSCQALFAVSAAIKLFVARHSSPSSPFLITYDGRPNNGLGSGAGPSPPPPSSTAQNVMNNPMFLQHMPSESNHEAIACEYSCECDSSSTTSSDSCKEEEEATKEEVFREQFQQQQQHQPPPPCGYYYMQMASPQTDFGWDFFNPFDAMRPHHEVIQNYRRCSESDDDLRTVREEEEQEENTQVEKV